MSGVINTILVTHARWPNVWLPFENNLIQLIHSDNLKWVNWCSNNLRRVNLSRGVWQLQGGLTGHAGLLSLELTPPLVLILLTCTVASVHINTFSSWQKSSASPWPVLFNLKLKLQTKFEFCLVSIPTFFFNLSFRARGIEYKLGMLLQVHLYVVLYVWGVF